MTVTESTTPEPWTACADTRVFGWLGAGWADFRAMPGPSLAYGLGFVLLSWAVIGFLSATGLEWMLLPAVSGALFVGPVIAVGLYQMSAARAEGLRPAIAAPGQIALVGGVLMVLLMTWIRAATILWALFYGLKPFPGFWETLGTLFLTFEGVAMLIIGSLIGGLFAALTFGITIFAIPMLVEKDIDAFTAMGRSFSASTHNMALTLRWGAAVTTLAVIGFATGMVGMVVIFPLLGFATWHAYRDVFGAGAA
ncbi:MAG: DUF2189 domain-containing protein [Pseudomonadota bacterium]